MIINRCSDALVHDQEMLDNGLVNVTYTDTECANYDTTNANVEKVTAFMKVMAQDESNPH